MRGGMDNRLMRCAIVSHAMLPLAIVFACMLRCSHGDAEATTPTAVGAAETSVAALSMPRDDIPGLPNFARVSSTLYRGAQPTAEGFRRLREMGVKTVVSLRSMHSDRELLDGTGMQYVRIHCEAWDPDSDEYAEFLKVALAPANQPVFVHCMQGVDRTGVAVASYRMVEQGWTADAAIAELDRFGHNEVFTKVKRFLRKLDPPALRRRAAAMTEPTVEVVP